MSVPSERDLGQDLDQELSVGPTGRADADSTSNGVRQHGDDEVEEEEEEEDEKEPNLKYSRLTTNLGSVYRNGDSTSTFMVAGDKMIIGTHNGNIHVLSVASLQPVRLYHAHSSSITAISVSPYSSSVAIPLQEQPSNLTSSSPISTSPSASNTPTVKRPQTTAISATPSNSIYIATSSIDGHVCVSSLIDTKDVTIRNYARPVQAVALSPQFKSDRTYISGGTAGSLILTVGGRTGVSSDANTNSAAAAAAGWLGAIGLSSSTGKDTILHSGEGAISTIQWSLTGRYIVWANEQGIKIMRSNLHLDSLESDLAWKRIAHVARPNRRIWEEMAGAWKARAVWVDDKSLEHPEEGTSGANGATDVPRSQQTLVKEVQRKRHRRVERLLVGWGDTVWMIHVVSERPRGEEITSPGKAEIVHQFVFSDGIVSGLTLYTPSLLLALVYRTRDDNDNPIPATQDTTPQKGRQRRQNGLPPDLRLIDLDSADKDEVEVEGLIVMNRYESLTAGDYHLSSIFNPSVQIQQAAQKSALEVIGGGLWDVGVGATRLFSSGASVLSGSSGDRTSISGVITSTPRERAKASRAEILPSMSRSGLKIFMHSPFDCVLAVRRDRSDRLNWLLGHGRFEDAWELICAFPDVVPPTTEPNSRSTSPSRGTQSLADFFADDRSLDLAKTPTKTQDLAVEKEKRRIGDLWIQQLMHVGDWATAGRVAGKVLGSSGSWERCIWAFAQANKFDEITPYIPTERLHPPLPSLVYEVVLGHYIAQDCVKLKDLLGKWSPALFDIPIITSAIEMKIESRDVTEDSVEDGIKGRDWHVLLDCLAKLYLADGRPQEALRCYIRTQHADAALELIRDYDLIDAVSDNIYGFVTIRISQSQIKSNHMSELEKLAAEPIRLLVSATKQSIIAVDTVVSQLQKQDAEGRPFIFFYFKALWQGDASRDRDDTAAARIAARRPSLRRSRFDAAAAAENMNSVLLAPQADLVVSLFAEYSRPLLAEYLRTSEDYSFDHASAVCERYHYIPELVHLLSATGQTKRALHLIIDELGDVTMAINFAKEIEEESLWNDLLDYSMGDGGKPAFIRGLLEEVSTSIDPVTLVRRIPEGLEIEGLKQGLNRLVRESEIMWSISEGAAKVLRTEVVDVTQDLRRIRTKGVPFQVSINRSSIGGNNNIVDSEVVCAKCRLPYIDAVRDDGQYLIGFPCRHIFHLTCLLDAIATDANKERIENLRQQLDTSGTSNSGLIPPSGKVGNKMAHAQMIQAVMGQRGCILCVGEYESPQQSQDEGE